MKVTKANRLKLRVQIAKDVIAQVMAEQTIPRSDYGSIRTGLSGSFDDPKEFQSILKKAECYACAKGAALIAYVRRFDGMNYDQYSDARRNLPDMLETDEMVKIFGRRMFERMEDLYEVGLDDTDPLYDKLYDLGNRNRMIAIMKGIVKSGGRSCEPVFPRKHRNKNTKPKQKQRK